MLGRNSAIRHYLNDLPEALRQRYGKSDRYTQGQVKTAIEETGLNRRYIKYAFLMYCEKAVTFDKENTDAMHKNIEYAAAGGFVGMFATSMLGGGNDESDSLGDFGGGDGGGV